MFHAVKMPPFTEKLLMHTHTQTLLLAKVNNGPEEFTILKPIHNGDDSSMSSNFRESIFKVENILKGSLDSIPSPSLKIQIMCGKCV